MQLRGRNTGNAGFRLRHSGLLGRNQDLHVCRDRRQTALRHAPFEHTMDQQNLVFHVSRTSDRRRMQPPLSSCTLNRTWLNTTTDNTDHQIATTSSRAELEFLREDGPKG